MKRSLSTKKREKSPARAREIERELDIAVIETE